MSITLRLDVSNVMQSVVGRNDGISEAQLAGLQRRILRIHESLKRRRQAGELAFYDLPYMRESIIEVMSFAAEQIGRFENYVHLGSGGSSRGPCALHGALNHPFHNYFTSKDRGGYPRLFFIDGFDPDTLSGLLAILDPRETLFNIVSHSGNAPETNASFLFFLAALKKRLGPGWRRQVIFTTHPEEGDLRAIARAERIKAFAIHPQVDERFFVLTPVGLLAAAFSGIDVHGLLHGAIEMDGACRAAGVFQNPAYLFAATHFLLALRKGKKSAFIMPCADCLTELVPWFHALWTRGAPRDGQPSASPDAMHKQNEGGFAEVVGEEPNERIFTLLVVEKYRYDTVLPVEFLSRLSFKSSAGKTGGEIVQSRQEGIFDLLASAWRPHVSITFPAVRPETVGEFVYMMHVAAVFLRELYASHS